MKHIYSYLDGTYYNNPAKTQYREMLLLGTVGFLLPFLMGHPQQLVGMLVNAFIIRSALSLPSKKALPVLLTPSLGAIARGAVFGPFTPFLLYMTPFIWAGNAILFYAFKVKIKNKTRFLLTLVTGAAAKAGFLYSTAYVLFSLSLIPAMFLTAMGMMQLYTAIGGGIVIYGMMKAEKYL